MKRTEANEIIKLRTEWSTEYSCVSIKQDDEGADGEAYFCHSGCDICSGTESGGAGDVFDVVFLAVADVKKKRFDRVHEGQLCGGCLCSVINGDDSGLDFSVNEEDA